jgi:hypothetical protein
MSDLDDEFQRGRRLRAAGRLDEALGVFEALARRLPTAAEPRHMRGLTLCNLERFDEGVADMQAAIAMQPRNAAFRADLGLVLFVLDRVDEAQAQLRRALMLAPGQPEALNNLSLVLRSRGDFAGAEKVARQALAALPNLHAAHLNLAYALLAQGRFAEAWARYNHRPDPRVNLRDPRLATVVPHVDILPQAPAPIVLHGEQGLGDTLFFLRFAPRLRERGHRLAFWGEPRLQPILARAGIFEHFIAPQSAPAEGLAVVGVGDLPGMLGASDPGGFPPALPIAGDPARGEALRGHLARLGPPPLVGLTWRAGTARPGRLALGKAVPAESLARALSGVRATFISLQRDPAPGEIAAMSAALGAPVHDGAPLNEPLEDALAAMEVLDEYVAVSNTNVHLRASAGRSARVLVPWPPEWRWGIDADRSPWFAGMPVYRQGAQGDWSGALERLRDDLRSALSAA